MQKNTGLLTRHFYMITLLGILLSLFTPRLLGGSKILASTAEPTLTSTTKFQCRIKVSSLNLREGPSTRSAIVGLLTRNTLFEGKERTQDAKWIFGAAPQRKGWISAAFLNCLYEIHQLPIVKIAGDSRKFSYRSSNSIVTGTPIAPPPAQPTLTPIAPPPAQPTPTPIAPPPAQPTPTSIAPPPVQPTPTPIG